MQLAPRSSTAAPAATHRQVKAPIGFAWRMARPLGMVVPRQHARHGPGLVAARCEPKQGEDAGREGTQTAWEVNDSMASPPHASHGSNGGNSSASTSGAVSNGSSSSSSSVTHGHVPTGKNGSPAPLPLISIPGSAALSAARPTSSSSHDASTQVPELGMSYSDYYKAHQMEREPPLIMAPASRDASDEPPSTAAPSTSKASSGSTSGGKQGGSSSSSVADALSRAQAALDRVEVSLEGIDSLPSARPPVSSHLTVAISAATTIATIGALCAALLASHAFGLVVQWLSAAAGGAAIATWGHRKGSLSWTGAFAAFGVGLATLGCSLRLGATLLAFFFSSSKLTQYKEEMKAKLDDNTKAGGQRDWVQVFCNAAVPTILAVAYGALAGCVDVPLGPLPNLEEWRARAATGLMGAFLGYYSCCCGDTWASELGPLSPDTPRLITSMRPVRKGTNGGVTLLGLCASIAGGAFIGLVFYVSGVLSPTLFIFETQHMAAIEQWRLVPLGLVAGLTGSVIDSVLGATLQYSGFNTLTGRVTSRPGPDVQHIAGRPFLSNNAVNLCSASLTACLTGLAALKAFGF